MTSVIGALFLGTAKQALRDKLIVGPDRLRNALDPGEEPARPIAAVACNPYVGHGSARQISFAYSEIVRSLENFPEATILRMTLCAQSSGLRWSAQSSPSARRYDVRSARCMKW